MNRINQTTSLYSYKLVVIIKNMTDLLKTKIEKIEEGYVFTADVLKKTAKSPTQIRITNDRDSVPFAAYLIKLLWKQNSI
jgi:hypothetical protein